MIGVEIKDINVISNCSLVKMLGDNIGYQLESGEICIGQEQIKNITSLANVFQSNSELLYNLGSDLYIINKNIFRLKFSKKNVDSIRPINSELFIAFRRESRRNNIYSIINSEGEELWSTSGNIFLEVYNETVVVKEKFNVNEFSCIDLLSGLIKWNFTAPLGFKIVNKPYFLNENIAIVLEDNEDTNRVIELDINTGEKVWDTKARLRLPQVYDNNLFEFASNTFVESELSILNIDQKTEECVSIPIKERTSGALNTVYKNFLFFSYVTNGCGIGIIDLRDKLLLKTIPLDLEVGLQITAPIVTSQIIGVKDSGNNLYLYEWGFNDKTS